MLIKSLIILLVFFSASLLAYNLIPLSLRLYSKIIKKRMKKSEKQLEQMFVLSQQPHLISIFTVTPLTLGLAGLLFMHNIFGLIIGVALGLILPTILIKNMGMRRQNKFESQLVDGLMLLSSSLKAGMSLNQAIEVLVEEMPSPISEEFLLVLRENRMGVVLEECFVHLKQRMPVDDLGLITTAISIARETGGDLTEIFSQLVFTIREKSKLEGKVKALTVQARLQGAIMGVLPIAFGAFVYFTNPRNFDIMLKDKLGLTLLVWACFSELIGIIMIKKLSKIEV